MSWLNALLLAVMRRIPLQIVAKRLTRFLDEEAIGRFVRFRTKDGILLDLDLSDHQPREIFCFGYYESNCVRWMKKWLKPGMVAIDAGANLGQYTLLAAHGVGRKGRVHAFEPHPENRSRLEGNIALNPSLAERISVRSEGLGNRRETVAIYSSPLNHSGTPSMVKRFSKGEISAQAEVIRLDDYAAEHGIEDVQFLKLDVEGYELKMLEGAERLLGRKSPMAILCELNTETFAHAGSTPDELLRYLNSFGFRAFVPRAFPLPLTPFRYDGRPILDNVLFLRA